jgi:hypothetical protein
MNKTKKKYPKPIDTYLGIQIWFNPITWKYYAAHCENTKKSIEKVKKWIKKYKN